MPVDARFTYHGQPWAPYVSAACLISAVAAFIQAGPTDALVGCSMLLWSLGMAVIWYRAEQGKKAMQYQLEAFISINVARMLNEKYMSKDRPSNLLEEAISDVQKEE